MNGSIMLGYRIVVIVIVGDKLRLCSKVRVTSWVPFSVSPFVIQSMQSPYHYHSDWRYSASASDRDRPLLCVECKLVYRNKF